MPFALALLVGIVYWLSMYDTHIFNWLKEPITLGALFGLIFGNLQLGLTIGAQIQLIYIVANSVGGNMPADKTLGAAVAVPLAVMNNLDPEIGLALAIPFAVVGPGLDNLRRMINVVWYKKAERDIENLNEKQLWLDAYIYPALVQLPIRVIPVTLLMYFGTDYAGTLVALMPGWLTTGLSTISNMLPALGMIACVRMIGRKNLLPYFFLGFFTMKVINMTTLTFTAFAFIIAILSMNLGKEGLDMSNVTSIYDNKSLDVENKDLQYQLSKKALKKTRFRSLFAFRIAQNMETFYGLGYCMAAQPCLKELYGHDPEQYKAALRRHMVPYISEASWGNCIEGAAMAMEEQMANGAPITAESITSVRTGLMGPFAGLGDTINGYILRPIIASVCIALALEGHVIPAFFYGFWGAISYILIGFPTFNTGYKLGKNSLLKMLKGGWVERVMNAAGILGMLMMGCLSSNYVKLSTTISWVLDDQEYLLQNFFDKILPGFLPLVLLVVSYLYMVRGKKASNTKLMLAMIVIGLVGAFVGIF